MSEWTDPKLIVDVLWKAGTLVGFAWLAIQNRIKVNKAAVDGLTEAMGQLTNRVTRVEQRQELAPSHADLEKLHARISEIRREQTEIAEDVAEITGTLKQINTNMVTFLQYHIPPGGAQR